jgi:hypothetical protein
MNMSKLELFHRYGIPSYPTTDSPATPLEKLQNFNVIPHINTNESQLHGLWIHNIPFLCDMSSLHKAILHLSTFIICLLSTIYLACHKMNYTAHHICLHFMYIHTISCFSVLSLQTLIIQLQLCFILLMKVTNFS